MTRLVLLVLAAVLMGREAANAQTLLASTVGVTSRSCTSCDAPVASSWRLTPAGDSSGERHLMRVAGLTIAGAAVGALAGAIHASRGPDCSADICGLRESQVHQRALFGALLGTVLGFSIGMFAWGASY